MRSKKAPRLANQTRGSEPQALPVIPRQSGVVKKRCGYQGSRLGSAQVFCGRLAGLAICDNVERDLLPLLARPHARAFDRADMNEDIFAAGLRLNKAEALLVIEPGRRVDRARRRRRVRASRNRGCPAGRAAGQRRQRANKRPALTACSLSHAPQNRYHGGVVSRTSRSLATGSSLVFLRS